MIWFTADTHWHHKNIIKYSHRPFQSLEEMDEALIQNWNRRVAPNDTVYHLGDIIFSNHPTQELKKILERLHGTIHLILGNHDKDPKHVAPLFASCGYYLEVKVDHQQIILMHYAMRVWNKSHHGSWHLYGHSHGSLPDDPNALSLDVGVDCHNYAPISLDEIAVLMAKKTFVPIDHHGT